MNIPDNQRAEVAAALGKQPWEIDFVVAPNGAVDVVPARQTTAEGTFAGTALRHGIGNAPGAAIGATAGSAAMTALGPMIDKGAELLRPLPGGSVAAPIAKFLGKAAAFAAPATLAKTGVERFTPVGDFKNMAIGGEGQAMRDRAESPWATSTGEFMSNFAGQGVPDVRNLVSGGAKLSTLRRLATRDMGLSTAESAAIQNAGGGAALGGGLELAREIDAGEDISPLDIAKHSLLGVANSGDVRKPLRRVGEGLAKGVGQFLPGGRELVNVPAAKQKSKADLVAEFKAKNAPTTAEPTVEPTVEPTLVDPLAEAMALGREATTKLRETEGVQHPYGAGSLRDRVAAWKRPEVPVEGPQLPPERPFTTADVQPENTLAAGPTTADTVREFGMNQKKDWWRRDAQPGEGTGTRGRPQPAQDTRTEAERMQDQLEGTGAKYQEIEEPLRFGQGPRNPVTQEFDAQQAQNNQAAYDAEMAAREKMNEVGRGIEGLATANPMMLPAGILRKATTADKPESMDLMGRLRSMGGKNAYDTGDMTAPKYQEQTTTAEPAPEREIPGAKALERRGFQYDVVDAPIPIPATKDRPAGLARGAFDPPTSNIELARSVANETTAKHEGGHRELQEMLLSGNPRLEKLAAEMTLIAGEENLIEGMARSSNAQEKNNRLRRLLEDNWNWLRTTKFGGGDKSPDRLARVLAERFDFQAPGPVKTGAAGTIKPQDMEDRPFVSGTEAFLMRGAPGVTFRRDGIVPESFNAWLSKQPRAEQELMAQAGLGDLVARGATADELVAHLRANGPRVNVLDYGMEGKVSEAKEQYDRLTHEWYDRLDSDTQSQVDRGLIPFPESDRRNYETAYRYYELGKQVRDEGKSSGPRATSAYNRVSAFPTDEPMPEWTASKLKNNVQRVDVALPHSDTVETKSDSGLDKFGPSYRNNDPMWKPDGLHENVPNTLGWAMIQYKTGPNGEKIATIVESQSRWGQTVRNAKQNPAEATGYERMTKDHPLLADYNRLILKAAVEQARKEGATHIVISDGESAMMTEGHDAAASEGKIDQEGGMRFNYDKAMPKIAAEMLGEGQRVSLGGHKNAMELRPRSAYERPYVIRFEDGSSTYHETQADAERELRAQSWRRDGSGRGRIERNPDAAKAQPRENLIFRNPDGSPKTDVSGMMYPIDAIATRRAAGEPMTLTGKRYQAMVGPDEFNTVPSSVLDVEDKLVAKAGYDFMSDKHRTYGATVNAAINDAKKLGGEEMWTQVANKRSAAFDSGTQPQYTPEEMPMAQRQQALYDSYAALRNAAGMPGRNAPNYTGHLSDIAVIREAEVDYPAFVAKYLPEYLKYNATQYGPAQKGGFDPVEAAQTFDDYFKGAARAPHSEFGADFGVLTKSARQYGLPPNMRQPYDFRHVMRFGDRFTRGVAEKKHLKDNPHVAQMLGLDDGGSPAGEQYRLFRSALAGQLPNHGKSVGSTGELGELYDATRQTVNTAIMQAPTGLWNTLSKVKDYGVVMAQNPEIGVKALMDATGDLFTNFGTLRREAIEVDAIRPGQDYVGANDNLGVASETARNMRNFNATARLVTGTEAIEQFNRVQDYALGKRLAAAALELQKNNNPAAADFWKRFGAGIDDQMPTDEILKRAAGNFVQDIQGSYGPEGLPAWFLTSGKRSLIGRLNRFGWENMRRTQRNVIEPARNGNWLPLLTYIGLAGVTAEVRKTLADKLLKQPSSLPTAEEIETAGGEPKVEQMLNLMEMADAAGAFGFAGSAMGSVAKNARGTKRAVVMDPTVSFGWQLAQNLAGAFDAMRDGEDAAPVVTEVLKRTLVDSIQNLRPLAADRGEALDRRNKKVFSDLTDRKNITTGQQLEGLVFGPLSNPGRKIQPTMEAAKKGDRAAYMKLSPEERRRADNYSGGYEDPKAEAAYRKFIQNAQGQESLDAYLQRRKGYQQRVRPLANTTAE